ncbi:MAG: sulfotransferase, partial [Planctomycetota bacterium]
MTDRLKNWFLRWFGPAVLCGATTRTWLRLLQENGFHISPWYVGRASLMTFLAVQNSLGKRIENLVFGKAIESVEVPPPVFVLGCWRSGTTHLHNLLSKDERFAFPNSFQVMNPHVFLSNESWNAPLQNFFYPKKRAMDNVDFSAVEPQEDEFAIAAMCGLSPMTAFCFWESRDRYNQYTRLDSATDGELIEWKKSLETFVRKLSFKYPGRPLVLKSPPHTARIRLLLELFPEARFVMIHRNPYEIAVSGCHMYEKNLPLMAMQKFDTSELPGELVGHYGGLFDAYFEQRDLIPDGRLMEVAFTDLERDPMGTLESIYRGLDLPEFSVARPAIQAYVDSLSDYKRNQHREIAPSLQKLVSERWKRCFEEWGYEVLESGEPV